MAFERTVRKGKKLMKTFYLLMALTLLPLLTMCSGPYGHMTDNWGGYGCTHGFAYEYGGMFMGFLFLVLLGVAIYFVVQSIRSKNGTGQTQQSPLDILKVRYAKGEISKEDFDRMKKDLE